MGNHLFSLFVIANVDLVFKSPLNMSLIFRSPGVENRKKKEGKKTHSLNHVE